MQRWQVYSPLSIYLPCVNGLRQGEARWRYETWVTALAALAGTGIAARRGQVALRDLGHSSCSAGRYRYCGKESPVGAIRPGSQLLQRWQVPLLRQGEASWRYETWVTALTALAGTVIAARRGQLALRDLGHSSCSAGRYRYCSKERPGGATRPGSQLLQRWQVQSVIHVRYLPRVTTLVALADKDLPR